MDKRFQDNIRSSKFIYEKVEKGNYQKFCPSKISSYTVYHPAILNNYIIMQYICSYITSTN